MKKKYIFGVLLLTIIGLTVLISKTLTLRPSPTPPTIDFLKLPPGFHAQLFAEGLGDSLISTPGPASGPRMMEIKNDTVFVSVPREGKVYALEDNDRDGIAETKKIFLGGLSSPHGIAIDDNFFYIAEEARVIRVKDTNDDGIAENETLENILSLPSPGGHYTRTIRIVNDKLFVSVGSSCNVCHETDSARAAIQRCDLDGKNCSVYAKGLRNAVGMTEYKGKIYATDNGRDWLGDNLPPDELNILTDGSNYGWPTCFGKNVHDTDFDKNTYIRNPCMEPFERESFVDLGSHVAPLGLTAYTGTAFPTEYKDKLFIALHGSWNATAPVGYKIVTVDPNTKEMKDFATGFLGNGVVNGRPVDIINFHEGLLVSDDNQGRIYRIYYDGK